MYAEGTAREHALYAPRTTGRVLRTKSEQARALLECPGMNVDTSETTGPVGLTTRSGESMGYGAQLLLAAIREVAGELSA